MSLIASAGIGNRKQQNTPRFLVVDLPQKEMKMFLHEIIFLRVIPAQIEFLTIRLLLSM